MIFNSIVFFITANLYALRGLFGRYHTAACAASPILFLLGNIDPDPFCRVRLMKGAHFSGKAVSLRWRKIPSRRLRICRQGSGLLTLFCISTAMSTLYLLFEIGQLLQGGMKAWLFHFLNVFLVESVCFWSGMIRVYLTSKQLAVKWRVLGLVCGYALSELGISGRMASLTTVNTPHRGCLFADHLLDKIPKETQDKAADTYNKAVKVLGDEDPDFMEAVRDLTAGACNERNEYIKDAAGVYYQSIGSKCNHAVNGRFPLNFTYYLVKYFGGENDGLVSTDSFPWGENYQLVTVRGKRGVSHGDMVDLNRENIPGFDVREFYVDLAADLKRKGF